MPTDLEEIFNTEKHIVANQSDYITFWRVTSWTSDDSLTGQGDPLNEEFQAKRNAFLPASTRNRKSIPEDFVRSEISMRKDSLQLSLMPVGLEMAIRDHIYKSIARYS